LFSLLKYFIAINIENAIIRKSTIVVIKLPYNKLNKIKDISEEMAVKLDKKGNVKKYIKEKKKEEPINAVIVSTLPRAAVVSGLKSCIILAFSTKFVVYMHITEIFPSYAKNFIIWSFIVSPFYTFAFSSTSSDVQFGLDKKGNVKKYIKEKKKEENKEPETKICPYCLTEIKYQICCRYACY